MPFVNFYLDLYQDPIQNKKYIGVHISMTHPKTCVTVSYMLAARAYSPSFAERNEEEASWLIYDWELVIFDDFGIKEDYLLAASEDSGSDVKRAMDIHFETNILREWCISHLINRALVDAFGTCEGKNNSKNPEACAVFDALRNLIEGLNKSKQLKL